MQAVVRAAPIRASANAGSDGAGPQANTVTAQSAQAIATMRNLPNVSPTGPTTNCTLPCVIA